MGSQEVPNETQNDSDRKLEEDGAICPKLYKEETKYKIVHLLKEPNGETENGSIVEAIWRNNIKDGRIKGTQHKVTARRSYCILNKFPSWVNIYKEENMFADALKRSAIVNISPEAGDNSTSDKSLKQLAKDWKWRWYDTKLKEELKPNIVVCGGTFWAAIEQIPGASDKLQQASTGMAYFWDKELRAVFLDSWHPSARFKHMVEYCYFRESCKEIITKPSW